jgi:transposase-like protein
VAKSKKSKNSGKEKIETDITLGASPVAEEKEESKSKTKYKVRDYDSEFCNAAAILAANGATQKKIAQYLGISIDLLRKWKRQYPEFKDSLTKGKEEVRKILLSNGLNRAVGYEYEEVCEKPVRVKDENGNLVYKNHRYIYKKHQSGDPRLLMFMLGCIDRMLGDDNWQQKDKLEIEAKTTPLKLEQAQSNQIAQLAGKLRKVVESKEVK